MAGPWERYKPAATGKPWERYGDTHAGSEDPAVMAEVEAEAAAAPGPGADTQAFQGARGAATPLGGESAGPLYRRLDPLELAGMQHRPPLSEDLMTPLLPVRGAFTQGAQLEYLAGQQPDAAVRRRMEIAAGVVKGAENVVGGGMEFMTSPVGAATLGMGALPAGAKAVASGAFAIDMARHAPDSWQKYWEARYREDAAGQAEAITEGLGNLAFAGLAGKHSFDSARAALGGAGNPAVALARALERSPMEAPQTRRPPAQTAEAPAPGPWDRYVAPEELDIARRIQDLRGAVEGEAAPAPSAPARPPRELPEVPGVPEPLEGQPYEAMTSAERSVGMAVDAPAPAKPPSSGSPESAKPSQTITGSKVQTGTEMPVRPEASPPAGEATAKWDALAEDIIGSLDAFAPARNTGARNYDLSDMAQRFVDFARADTTGRPLDALVKEFAKTDQASAGQVKKLKAAVSEVAGKYQPATKPAEPVAGPPPEALAAPAAPAPAQVAKAKPKRKAAAPPEVAAPKPVETPPPADVRQYLVAEVPETGAALESVKAADRVQANLREQARGIQSQIDAIEKEIRPQRGSKYARSQIKKSAPKARVAQWRNLQLERQRIEQSLATIDEQVREDRRLLDRSQDAKVITDEAQPLARRIDRKIRQLQDLKEPVPPELIQARAAEIERLVRDKYPDATPDEVAAVATEVERSIYFNDSPGKLPHTVDLHALRRQKLNAALNAEGVPKHLFSEELNAELQRHRTADRPFSMSKEPVEPLTVQKLNELLGRITEETNRIHEESRREMERQQAEAEAQKAKEEKLLAEAQAVVNQAKRTGTVGGRSPVEVKKELLERILQEVKEAVDEGGVKITRDAGDPTSYTAQGDTYAARGIVRKKESGKWEVEAVRLGNDKSKVRGTVDSMDEALLVIKGMAAMAKGRAVVAVPGDGVYRFQRDGAAMLGIWQRARGLDTSKGAGSGQSRSSGEAPPRKPIKTQADWVEAKEFHGLDAGDTIASWSERLAEVARKVNPEAPQTVTVRDVDAFIERKLKGEKEPEQGPPAPDSGLPGHALGDVGMGGARPTEFTPGGNPTSIKNAVVDQERIARGLPPAMEPLRRTWGTVWDEAMALIDRAPDTQEALILELRSKPRSVTDLEDALLLHRQVDLQNEYARHARELAMAYEGREAYPERLQDVERHRALLNETSNRLQELYDINKAVGTYTARGLAARKMMVDVDFTLAAMELELRAAKDGRPLSDGERQQLQQAHDRIQQLEGQFKEAVARADALAAEKAIAESLRQMRDQAAAAEPVFTPEVKSLAERIVEKLEVEAEAARRRLREKFARTSAGVDPTIIYDLSVIGAAKIARGVLNKAQFVQAMLDDLGDGVRPYLDAAWDAANGKIDREVGRMAGAKAPDVRQAVRRQDPTQQRQRILEAMERSKAEGVPIEELGDLVRRLALNFVRSGIVTRDALIDAVHAELVKLDPEITRRQSMDAISGYGQFRPLDPNQYKAKLRDLKGQMQQVAKLEDIQNRQPPLKTGVERRTPTDEERRLIAQVNEAKRRYGVVSTDPARQLAGALDSIKTRLRNQISDLEHQLATRERIVKDRSRTEYDSEAKALEARRDALKMQFDAMFPKPGISMEQRVAMAEKAIERDIAEYERRITAGDIGPLRGRQAQLRGAKLDALRARRDALRDELDALRRAARNDPAAQLADLKARMSARLADYQDRIARGDYTPNRRPEVRMDNEALRIKAQLEIAKANWKRGVELTALRNRALPHRVLGGVRESLNLPRTVLSSWDVSAVLRQGGFIALGHPLRAARALGPMFRALASQERAAMVEQEIMARPNAPLYHRAKLYLAPLETTRLTSMEEAFMSRFASRIPGVGASQRAFVTFLNKLRADSFDAMVDTMQRRGPELNQAELQAVANYVNIATGRGDLGKAAAAAETLATVLFSPRLVASRFQLLSGKPFYDGSSRTRRMVAAEYARFLGAMAVVYGLANLMGASVEADPRSSDFGKLRFGNTRVDPLAGLSQVAVLMSRLTAGQTKALDGTVKPLRGAVPFGQDTSADVIARFLRSKLSPVVGAGVDVLSGQNVVGEPVAPADTAKRLLVPLSFGEIYEVMRANGVPKGAALGILSLFGWGLQQHDDPAMRQMLTEQMRRVRGGSPEDREALRRLLRESATKGGGAR